MTQHPAPLGDVIASLRKAPAEAPRGMLPAALHTLITAILTRIFARLEALLLLWQTGERPTPRHRAPKIPAKPRVSYRRTRSAREYRQAKTHNPPQLGAPARIRARYPLHPANPRATSRPRPEPLPARARRRTNSLIPRRQTYADFVTIS